MDEIQSLLDFRQPRGVNVHLVGVTRKFRLQLAHRLGGLRVELDQIRRARIHALKFGEPAADHAGLREQRVFVLAQSVERGLAQLQEFCRIARTDKFRLDGLLFVRLQTGGGNLLDLKA